MFTRHMKIISTSIVLTTTALLLGAVYLFLGIQVWAAPAQSPVAAPVVTTAASQWAPQQPGYRITVDTTKPEGLYQLDYNALASAGLPVDTLDPHTFRLFWMGEEVAIEVTGEADNHFDADDSILFYGRNLDDLFFDGLVETNKYSGTNSYWLSYGGPNGKRMQLVDGSPVSAVASVFPHKQHLEQNHYYVPTRPYVEGEDHWFWQKITAFGSGSKSKDYTFSANNIATDIVTGSLKVKLFSVIKNKQHDLTLLVNGHEVYHNNTDWVGNTAFIATAVVPQAYFQEGSNTITVKVTNNPNSGGAVDVVYPNWMDVTYYDTFVSENNNLVSTNLTGAVQQQQISNFDSNELAVYDVSDLKNVRRVQNGSITGSGPFTIAFDSAAARLLTLVPAARQTPTSIEAVTYLASAYTPENLLDTSNAADYIIITHRDFWAEALQLANHRAAEYHVVMVDAQQIYDQFNGSVMSAEAIHDFLSYTYNHWAKRPTFVLLIGDGTYDMRNYRGSSFPTYIPVFLHLVGSITGETASENRFVTLENDTTYGDLLPDMHLGRFPVNSPDEAQAMVDKTINYETATCATHPQNVIFAADDEDGELYWQLSDGIADGYVDAPTNTVKYLPAPYTYTKRYLGKTCNYASDGNATSGDECRQQLIDEQNDTGALLVSYVGHSTKNFWAVEQIWNESAVDQLTNTNACELPVMLSMGCDEGNFHDPADTAVSEYGVRKLGVGPVATISPTYYGFPRKHDTLEKGFFKAVFQSNIKELGKALTWAKQNALNAGNETEADGFMLLGDPALKLRTNTVNLGNYVWWDVNADGVQDAGEPPLQGITVTLKDAGGSVLAVTTTDMDGFYRFEGLDADDYKVQFTTPDATWSISPKAQTTSDKDSDANSTSGETDLLTLSAGMVETGVDAGMTFPTSYTITKKNTTVDTEITPGDAVSFTIRITNTGQSWLTAVPLQDVYDTNYLRFVSATPAADDTLDDGALDWSDLTDSFGTPLLAGDHFVVIVNFIAKNQTSDLPDDITLNTARAHDIVADPDGPNGANTITATLADQSSSDSVNIHNPVGESMGGFSLVSSRSAVMLKWQSASEINIFGFNVLRSDNGGTFEKINTEIILAQHAGADIGASYHLIDQPDFDGHYRYQLEILHLDGTTERYGMIETDLDTTF